MIARLLCLLGFHRWFDLVRQVEPITYQTICWQRCTRKGCGHTRVVGVPFPEL